MKKMCFAYACMQYVAVIYNLLTKLNCINNHGRAVSVSVLIFSNTILLIKDNYNNILVFIRFKYYKQ